MEQDNSEIMAAYSVIFDGLARLGPGDSGMTSEVLELIRASLPSAPRVADLGCGVGASALVLAESLPDARVLALDMHEPFISRLHDRAIELDLGERISAVAGDMTTPAALDGISGQFDLIWSESAIYSIGRDKALRLWRPLLRPGGWLVFSDLVWSRERTERSAEAVAFWTNEYPDLTDPGSIKTDLTSAGFRILDPIICPPKVWSNYYEPLRIRLNQLEQDGLCTPALTDLMAEMKNEIAVYDQAGDQVSVAFFLAQRDSTIE